MAITKLDTLPLWQAAIYVDGVPANKGTAPIWGWRKEAPNYAPPAIGERLTVRMNGLGPAKVVGYFTEGGYLGLRVKLETPPVWWIKQNADKLAKGETDSYVFGSEVSAG